MNERLPKQLDNGHYGGATRAVNQLLQLASRMEHFTCHRLPAAEEDLLVEAALRGLQGLGVTLSEASVRDRRWDEIAAVQVESEKLSSLVGPAVTEATESLLRSESVRSFLTPPIWPIAGESTVMDTLTVAQHGDPRVLGRVPDDDASRRAAWSIASDLEMYFCWSVQWSVSRQVPSEGPLVPLLELVVAGYIPTLSETSELQFVCIDSAERE